MTGRLRRNISVPSSSGKSLQQSWCSIRSMGAHISVPSSSGKSLQLPFRFAPWQEPLPISVPSSSGKSLQRQLSARAFYVWANFSPLFIGEITSTPNWLVALLLIELISVPSSSGKSLQLQNAVAFMDFFTISVPSSSGKSLQRLNALSGKISNLAFQSPLHRGNHFNAGEVASFAGRGIYFSPLFIGEITSTAM